MVIKMALFGSDSKKTTSMKKVRPTVVRTQNVAKELMNFASSYDIKVETLDFNLLSVQTYTRMNAEGAEGEWEEISSSEVYELDDKTALLNPHFEIKQMYEIEMFQRSKADDKFKDFHASVGANATKCKVYLSIKEGSKLSYFPRFEEELRNYINKKKVRANILINIFDGMLYDAISEISAFVQVQENALFTQTQTYLIAESYEPTLTKNDELILHYDKKDEVDENTKVDYAKRGFIQSVLEDELLIEYIKPQEGKPGRNCRGEYMNPKEPEVKHAPTFNIDDSIKMIETPQNIEYRAKENGYIALEGTTYLIKTDVDIGEISFKTTGSISTGLDSDVSISVKEKDALKDAVGTGMEVEVSEITIEGNVGSSAKVNAIKATIEGQVHKTAMVRAHSLKINVHKGMAYGRNIHITRLEHGIVDGDSVEIAQAVGGEIRAKELTIDICASYVKATASRFIEIKKLQGGENVFVIDPLLKKDTKEDFGDNQEHINELERDIRNIKQEIEKYKKMIKDGMPAFNDLKKRLLHYKKNGVKLPSSFVKQYKQFQKLQEHLQTIKNEHEQKKDKLKLLTSKTSSFQENIFDARIINKDHWEGHNELKFKLVDPPIEVTYNPPEGSVEKVFALVEVDEGQYEIKAVKE